MVSILIIDLMGEDVSKICHCSIASESLYIELTNSGEGCAPSENLRPA